MRVLAAACLAILIAGCVAPAAPISPASTPGAASTTALTSVASWKGHVIASELDSFSHVEPSEQALFAAQQEGWLLDIKKAPAIMEVSLDWTGDAAMMIMLHSHKAHGTNTYVEHDSPMDKEHPKCIRVPAADLSDGEWQVMVHTDGARNADFTLSVSIAGGDAAPVEGKMHGHDLQDGQFQVDEHDVLPCGH